MKQPATLPTNATEYQKSFPASTRTKLKSLHELIAKAAPEAEQSISYGMPAFKSDGPLVYYAGYDNHIGFYPTPSAIMKFKDKLSKYKTAKGSIQFPLTEEIPAKLVTDIVKFRVQENKEKASLKKSKKR